MAGAPYRAGDVAPSPAATAGAGAGVGAGAAGVGTLAGGAVVAGAGGASWRWCASNDTRSKSGSCSRRSNDRLQRCQRQHAGGADAEAEALWRQRGCGQGLGVRGAWHRGQGRRLRQWRQPRSVDRLWIAVDVWPAGSSSCVAGRSRGKSASGPTAMRLQAEQRRSRSRIYVRGTAPVERVGHGVVAFAVVRRRLHRTSCTHTQTIPAPRIRRLRGPSPRRSGERPDGEPVSRSSTRRCRSSPRAG